MLNMPKYQKMEAVEELLDDYELIIANLDAEIAFINEKQQTVESELKKLKPTNVKVLGYQLLSEFKKEIHFNELMKLTYLQYQDGLHEKLKNMKSGRG